MGIRNMIVLLLLGIIRTVNGQTLFSECPSGWIAHSSNCYKFVADQFLVFEEADAACGAFGSHLLAVSDAMEHNFVTDWLKANNLISRTVWFTSGWYVNGVLYWEGEDRINYGNTYWILPPDHNSVHIRLAYAYGDTKFPFYGWSLISPNTPSNYICEVPKSEALNLQIQQRDFKFGADMSDPTNVKRGPMFIQQPETVLVVEGSLPAEIECSATGNSYPEFTWWLGKDYNNVTELTSKVDTRYTISGGQLTIDDPGENDIGSYHCKAENDVGAILSSDAQLVYGYLGYFSNIDPEPVYASVFRGTKMDCNAPAHAPDVTYEWFKNAATNVFVWPNNGNMFVSRAGFLYVTEVQPTDANKRYYCVVTLIPTEGMKTARAFMPSRTNLGLLLLLTSDSSTDNDYGPILNTHAFPTPALVGRTIYLECIAYGSHPLTYSWQREDGKPFVKGTVISARSRVLSIPNAPLEAEGNYVCSCTSRSTGATARKVVSVSMETAPYFPEAVHDVFADPDMRISLYCKAVARPTATYFWYKDGVLLRTIPGQIEVRNSVLTIFRVEKIRDEGMYQCGATNQHGTAFRTSQLKVLHFKPNFHRYPMQPVTLAPIGGNITIPCGVESAPVPQVRWLKNGQDLNINQGETSGRMGIDAQFGLQIRSVDYSDQARYACVATNDLGEASNYTDLQVIEGITITTPPAPTNVIVNRTAFMFCHAAYDVAYDLTYIWKFNGRIINFHINPEYVIGSQNNLNGLYVTNAQYKHSGLYECEARTTLHSVSKTAVLDVTGPPGPMAGCYVDDDTITSRSVRIVWTVLPAMERGAPISHFDVEAETNYNPGEWTVVAKDIWDYDVGNLAQLTGKRDNQRAYVVQNLIPNTSYRFRVRAMNIYGRGALASRPTHAVKIFQTAPIIPPRNVGGGGGKVGTLVIRWEPLDISEHCGPGLGYYIYWKRLGDEKDWRREVGTGEEALKHGFHVVTVGMDNYYIEYKVKVGAFNDLGTGPNSTEQIVYSAEGMPNSVPIIQDCETYNSTSIIVHWEPVPDDREHMKGQVAGYRIHFYERLGDETTVDEPDPAVNFVQVKDVYGQKSEVMLIGLNTNAEYYVRVQVFNTAGAGPKGEWRWAETAINPLKDYPTHVAVHPHTEHSVKVTWRGVVTHPGEDSLIGYILRVWKVQDDIRSALDTVVDKVQEAVLSGLQSQTVYELRVIGFSRAGEGAKSNAIFFTVLGGNIPFDPSTTEICYYDDDNRTCQGNTNNLSFSLLLIAIFSYFLKVMF